MKDRASRGARLRSLISVLSSQPNDESFAQSAQQALDRGVGSLTHTAGTLADLLPGECGYVLRVDAAVSARLRLLEMGLTEGVHVKVIRRAAFGGPIFVQLRGYELSLRREEAAGVFLGPSPKVTSAAASSL